MHEAECPYCCYMNNIELEGLTEFDCECERCKEEFEVIVEYDPHISTQQIVFKKCIDCGDKYRYTGQSFPRPSKYQNLDLKNYYVCRKCWHTEFCKDMSGG